MKYQKLISNKYSVLLLSIFFIGSIIASCTHDDRIFEPAPVTPGETQVKLQVAYDATDVAFRFTWKTQKKLYPTGLPNTGKNYPMQFHDMLMHNGTKFDRLPSGERMEEDRISVMLNKTQAGIQGFAEAGCAIICHTNMDSHHLLTNDVLDHWHWRGARSGPMGYAEDVAINNTERIRDNLGTLPTKFLRSGGDRLRENQEALAGTGHPVLVDGLPRFVFNKGKNMPSNFTIPSFFLVGDNNAILINPQGEIPTVKNVDRNTSLLVVYQDKTFDTRDKMNSLDLGYLVYVALGSVDHLPAHLRDVASTDFNTWRSYWAAESNITTSAAALTKLNEIHAEWNSSNKKAMVTRSVGFIYPSDQHDVKSERSFNPNTNEWTVTLFRKLRTDSNRDEDLSELRTGAIYGVSFAMHDSGAGSETHDISLPYKMSNANSADIQAVSVSNIQSVDWNSLPALETNWVKQALMPKYTSDWLKSAAHPGASSLESVTCATCHTDDKSLLNSLVLD
ncbi:ethylbenzene dehydrogenase-related protein [Belliella aquatica]|uniref:Cytochrome c-552/DMSO reductase-like haem-binding domain-containing protein n=1 Tax=Belliella aquatica TaxID=1323734 RepID=A0ABQ1M4A8_9BACT|nr:ethylbenzene dehydrogenase-related protein [Belliella aquatica]MCH7404736.1 ethylbenzene dehydrogenase-related protein [Belliella aquatica]GGC34502.1 hypothetical protein GCM10010993_11800 [Belliella aquatica]